MNRFPSCLLSSPAAALIWVLCAPALATAQERVLLEQSAPPAQAVPPAYMPPTEHQAVAEHGPALESDEPWELAQDLRPGLPGDAWGQSPLSEFLKGDPYRLAYVGGSHSPPPGERLGPALAAAWMGRTEGQTYGFVMFQGRISASKLAAVEATGARLGEFRTFYSFTAVIPFSAIPGPSVFPGLISLSHGGLFGPTFAVWPALVSHNGATGAALWATPIPRGVPRARIYSQAALIDPANPNVAPIRVSERDDALLH